MCAICGCCDTAGVTITDPVTGQTRSVDRGAHEHAHALGLAHEHRHEGDGARAALRSASARTYRPLLGHAHGVAHPHPHALAHGHVQAVEGPAAVAAIGHATSTIVLEQAVLSKNQRLADRNREWFARRGILALNLVSSPGSGKTTLLERTIRALRTELTIEVVEGDQATLNDAERIRATGCKVIQINTGAGCHLEADMLARGVAELDPPAGSVLMIENVGNLVCPALFDLGERAKVVILSVTEGEDKPLKYPHMFKASDVMLLNKVDLLPHLRFDAETCIAAARQVNPSLRIFRVSAQTGEGMEAWYGWLRERTAERGSGRSTA